MIKYFHKLESPLTYILTGFVSGLVITIKDNKPIEVGFLENESQTMMTFVSKVQSQSLVILDCIYHKCGHTGLGEENN